MASCKLVISAVALPASVIDQQNPGPIRSYLLSQGLMSTAQKALMFTDDGETGCNGIAGIAEWYNDERTTTSNQNNQGAMLARVFGWCWSPVGYIDVASEVGAHELSHTLGAVGDTAPNSSYRTGGRSHCTDGIDLMCYDDGGGEPRAVCADAYPPTLDCNQDDYFNPSPPAGSYLATHWNTAQNQYLAKASPGSFQVPPRPMATVTSPGSSVVAGVVNASATAAAASDGAAIVQVEFWLGNDLVGTDAGAPYTSQFDTVLDGPNGFPNGAVLQLVAVAVDAQGRTGPSTPITVTIGNPKIRLTAPVAWARQAGPTVTWSASASAYTGRSVSKVELLEGGSVLAADTSAPYGGSISMTPGGHVLEARVTDNGGVSRDSVARAVFIGPTGPQVTLVAPAPYEYAPAATGRVQHLAATAVAPPGKTISSVTFTANGTQIGSPDTTSPYEVNWTPATAGPYEIVAHATDSAAGLGDSDPSTVYVGDAPADETVTITSPANDAHVSTNVNVTVAVALPMNWAINSLEIEIDGNSVATASGSETVPVDLTGYVGWHVLRAVLDASDQVTPFEEVTVSSAGTNILLPGSIAITAPASGTTLSGTATVTGIVNGVDPTAASPLFGILGEEFYVAYLYDPGFSGTFDSTGLEDGSTTLQLEDSSFGLHSPPIAVTLKNAGASMTAPASGATVTGPTTISVKATADGGVAVEQVRFFVDGADKGGDRTAPYQFSWNPDGLANGSHTLRADAILSDGRTLTTGSRTVTLKAGAVTRLAGADRYATAVAISKGSFPTPGVPVVYIANGVAFPDALAGAPVAGRDAAPLLLVPGTSIPDVVKTELSRLKPGRIVVLGGTASVSDAVKTSLKSYTAGAVTRLAGADRYATAVAISKGSFPTPGVPVVYIANGVAFPDALAGAPVAGRDAAPLLLVPGTSIPDVVKTELSRLKPGRIVVLGGTASVSDAVKTSLKSYTAGAVTRLAGADRYATAVAISKGSFPTPGVPVVYIANGVAFPDALAGAPVAGRDAAPLLLVPGTSIPDVVKTELSRLKPGRIVVLGGTASVSDAVKTSLVAYLGF